MTAPIVQVIGAKWCAQCPAIKQSVTNWCAMVGLTPELLDYNELESEDATLYASITSLPTIRIRATDSAEWQVFCGKNYLDACKAAIVSLATLGSVTDTEF